MKTRIILRLCLGVLALGLFQCRQLQGSLHKLTNEEWIEKLSALGPDLTALVAPPHLVAPAPSIRRLPDAHFTAAFKAKIPLNSFTAISDQGICFFTCFVKKNGKLKDKNIIAMNPETMTSDRISLREGWEFYTTLNSPDPSSYQAWGNDFFIPLVRPIQNQSPFSEDSDSHWFGLYDVNTRSITEIAPINLNRTYVLSGNKEVVVVQHKIRDSERLSPYWGKLELIGKHHRITWDNARAYTLDASENGKALLWDDREVYLVDISNPALRILVPTEMPHAKIRSASLHSNESGTTFITCRYNNVICYLQYNKIWAPNSNHKNIKNPGWVINTIYDATKPDFCYEEIATDHKNLIGLERFKNSYNLISLRILATGEKLTAYAPRIHDESTHRLSRNGSYIAAVSQSGDCLLRWKVRGLNLAGNCTLRDRQNLHDLQFIYRTLEERRNQLDTDYLASLDHAAYYAYKQDLCMSS